MSDSELRRLERQARATDSLEDWRNWLRAFKRASGTEVALRDWEFFFENAGYIVGQRGIGALELAEAERTAIRLGWFVSWEPEEMSYRDMWGDDGEAPQDTWEVAVLRRRDPDDLEDETFRTEVLDSLGGIGDATPEYRRVVEAELAHHAIAQGYADDK